MDEQDGQERLRRSREAERLTSEPLLTEALARMETDRIEEALKLPAHAFLRRHLALAEVRAIRGIRSHLSSLIMDGRDLSRSRPTVV